MTRVDDNRQMAQLFYGQDSAEIQSVARICFKSTDAPFAENDVTVAFRHNIFRRHEPFFNGRAETAFQKDWLVRPPQRFKKIEVLHIPCSHLDEVYIFFKKKIQFIGRHDFRNDRQPCFLAGSQKHIQAGIAQSLERIGRCPRFKGAAAQHDRTGSTNIAGDTRNLIGCLNRAGACNNRNLPAAYGNTVNMDNRIFRMESSACPLIRSLDGNNIFHIVKRGHFLGINRLRVTDDADNRFIRSFPDICSQALPVQSRNDLSDFFV